MDRLALCETYRGGRTAQRQTHQPAKKCGDRMNIDGLLHRNLHNLRGENRGEFRGVSNCSSSTSQTCSELLPRQFRLPKSWFWQVAVAVEILARRPTKLRFKCLLEAIYG